MTRVCLSKIRIFINITAKAVPVLGQRQTERSARTGKKERKKKSWLWSFIEEREMAEEGQVIGVHTIDQWKEHFEIGKESKKLVVVDFTASWCGPCRMIAPILADLAKKMSNVIFLKVDVDELKSLATEWDIEAMPTFIFLKEGKMVDKIVGARKDHLSLTITKHATAAA